MFAISHIISMIEGLVWKKKYIYKGGSKSFDEVTTHIRVAVMVAASLLSTLLLALAVAAQPFERQPSLVKTKFFKQVSQGANVVKQDQLRVNNIKGGKTQGLKNREVINSPGENRAVTYVASVGVGSPATICKWLRHLVAD